MRYALLAALLLIRTTGVLAYAGLAGGTVSVGNRLDYSISSETSEEILENYFDIDYSNGPFLARLRYEVFQPSEGARDREGLVFRSVGVEKDGFDLLVGHFYALLGRGLAYRGYEDRELRVDTSLDGLKLSFTHDRAALTAFSGRTHGESQVFHAGDGELHPLEWLTVGGSYVSRRDVSTTGYEKPSVELGCGRGQIMVGPVDLYAEVAHRTKDGEKDDGRGVYVAASGYVLGAGFSLEYKDYEQMSLKAEGREYSNPPAALPEHVWALLSKHSRELDVDDERGFLAHLEYQVDDNAGLAGTYVSAENHGGTDLFEETTVEARLWELSSYPIHAVAGRSEEYLGLVASGEEEVEDRRVYVTAMAEGNFPIAGAWSGKLVVGHQHADGDAVGEYDLEHVEVELTKSPGISIALVGEWSNVSSMQRDLPWLQVFSERTVWVYGQLFLDLAQGHQLRLLVGSRPEGKVCAGGVCRIEPEFEGIEFTLISMF